MVAAFRSNRGASRQLLMTALEGGLDLLVSMPLMIEYEAVLTRIEHLAEIGLACDEVNEVLDAVARVAVPVSLHYLWRPRLKDSADEMVLEAAVNGNADALVTFNLRHLAEGASEFGLHVMLPREAWKRVQKI